MSNDSPIIRITDVSKYFDAVAALSHVSLDVASGEKVVIIGRIGSGKSTIARMVMDYYLLGKLPKGPAKEDESAVEADEG